MVLALIVVVVVVSGGKGRRHGNEVAEWVRRSRAEEESGTLALAKARLAELVAYYGGDEGVLESVKFASGGTRRLEERLARAALGGEAFVIAALGSSVTAGHDGFLSTAWPAVLERATGGFGIEVRNQAVGGRTPFPASLCVRTIAGPDADMIVREWEYWSLDEGLEAFDDAVGASGVELFVRTTMGLPKHPTVVFLQLDADGESRRTKDLIRAFEGPLAAYGDAGGGVVVASAFGAAFDGLRAAAPKVRQSRTGHTQCSGRNLGDCPLALPDGYHARAKWDGLDLGSKPSLAGFVRPAKLFINWHPGALGHEVVGNQLAYFLLTALVRGLRRRRDEADDPEILLPAASRCGAPLCRRAPRCAISTLPAAVAPSIGDLVDNTTMTRWTDSPTDAAADRQNVCAIKKRADCGGKADVDAPRARLAACFDWLRRCSYRDQKRGFKGSRNSGPLTLRVPFDASDACVAYLVEPGQEWSKPLSVANWHHELHVSVDGTPCSREACRVIQAPGAYVQALRVDVKRHRADPSAACAPAAIGLAVHPLDDLASFEAKTNISICAVARNGRCEPSRDWRRYNLKCDPGRRHGNTQCNVNARARHRSRADVSAFVEAIIYF